ncbi:MAG: rod shape-determining protein RodA [Bacillota bacterium]
MAKLEKKLLKRLDYGFIAAVAAILTYSIFVLTSASESIAQGMTGDPLYFVKKQLLWVGIGIVALLVILSVDYLRLERYSKIIYIANILLLVAVLIPGVGNEAKGATRWIDLGPVPLQPSEFAKLGIIISFAHFLAARQGRLNTLKELLPCFAFVGIPMLLILRQPDLGTSLVFIGIAFGMLFIAGARPALLGSLVVTGITGVILALVGHFRWGLPLPLKDYQLMRLVVFLNPYNDGAGGRDSGYQMIQSLVAIGSGSWWGKGWKNGSQVQLNFLPEHHTDFIFSVLGEELGLVGGIALLALFFYLIYRAIDIAYRAKDLFGTLVVTGVTSMFVFQLLVNVGMTIGMMPITGVPLPLFSYGGSSMLTNLMALGLIININIRRQKILF